MKASLQAYSLSLQLIVWSRLFFYCQITAQTTSTNKIDLEGCLADMYISDLNDSGALERSEYLIFINTYWVRKCAELQDALTLQQSAAFTSLACQCTWQDSSGDCCLEGKAKLPQPSLNPALRSESDLLFLSVVCSVTDQTIPQACANNIDNTSDDDGGNGVDGGDVGADGEEDPNPGSNAVNQDPNAMITPQNDALQDYRIGNTKRDENSRNPDDDDNEGVRGSFWIFVVGIALILFIMCICIMCGKWGVCGGAAKRIRTRHTKTEVPPGKNDDDDDDKPKPKLKYPDEEEGTTIESAVYTHDEDSHQQDEDECSSHQLEEQSIPIYGDGDPTETTNSQEQSLLGHETALSMDTSAHSQDRSIPIYANTDPSETEEQTIESSEENMRILGVAATPPSSNHSTHSYTNSSRRRSSNSRGSMSSFAEQSAGGKGKIQSYVATAASPSPNQEAINFSNSGSWHRGSRASLAEHSTGGEIKMESVASTSTPSSNRRAIDYSNSSRSSHGGSRTSSTEQCGGDEIKIESYHQESVIDEGDEEERAAEEEEDDDESGVDSQEEESDNDHSDDDHGIHDDNHNRRNEVLIEPYYEDHGDDRKGEGKMEKRGIEIEGEPTHHEETNSSEGIIEKLEGQAEEKPKARETMIEKYKREDETETEGTEIVVVPYIESALLALEQAEPFFPRPPHDPWADVSPLYKQLKSPKKPNMTPPRDQPSRNQSRSPRGRSSSRLESTANPPTGATQKCFGLWNVLDSTPEDTNKPAKATLKKKPTSGIPVNKKKSKPKPNVQPIGEAKGEPKTKKTPRRKPAPPKPGTPDSADIKSSYTLFGLWDVLDDDPDGSGEATPLCVQKKRNEEINKEEEKWEARSSISPPPVRGSYTNRLDERAVGSMEATTPPKPDKRTMEDEKGEGKDDDDEEEENCDDKKSPKKPEKDDDPTLDESESSARETGGPIHEESSFYSFDWIIESLNQKEDGK